ncbi:cytochrome c oxidase assembly protein [Ahrensia sp. 13_GOM-1096m]|uniref:cytochrome c oxidase assembly protein n=1 Tax=Ahrensia sp. 13_GOM-1096m TaxID=1380380 RepID=UPI000A42BFCA|nr:cytochrome c oxidase assembly protein [Ahrensia sp. 13_GOM-1096m]
MDQATGFSFDMSYCGLPPAPEGLWSRWNFDPILLIALVVLFAVTSYALRHAEKSRQVAFWSAWVLTVVLFVSPICALTVSLFSARVSHHVLLTMIVAPLLAAALPTKWGQNMKLLPALLLSTVLLWFWHLPDLYASAFRHPTTYWTMQLTLLSSYIWLWLGLLRARSAGAAAIVALGSATQMGFLGALLVFAPQPLYLPHMATTLAFGFSPLDDQQLAGLIMWVPANLPLLAAVLWRLTLVLSAQQTAMATR